MAIANAGDLDRRITIEQRTTAPNAIGEPVETWAPLSPGPATVWAMKRDLTGREVFAGRREVGEAATVFTLRYRADLDRAMRIVHAGINYDIESITEIGRHARLEILTRARVD